MPVRGDRRFEREKGAGGLAMGTRRRIGIDLLFMTEMALRSGVCKYAVDLLDGLGRLGVLEECVLFVREDFAPTVSGSFPEAETVSLRLSPVLSAFERRKVRGAGILQAYALFWRTLPRAVRRTDVGVLLHPFNDKALRIVPGIPNIVVIHDLFYLHYGASLSPHARWLTRTGHRHFVAKADRIAAISRFVRDDILSCFPNVSPERVAVLPNAVAMPERTDVRPFAHPAVRSPYILCVNSLTITRIL